MLERLSGNKYYGGAKLCIASSSKWKSCMPMHNQQETKHKSKAQALACAHFYGVGSSETIRFTPGRAFDLLKI
jgi:hypothetical protein